MRGYAWLLGASLLLATPAEAAPRRVASLNLCTDELLLLLGAPDQIVSVSHLGRRQAETALWRKAQAYPANDGTLLSVLPHRPELVLAMGGGGRDRSRIAHRLGIALLELPYPQSLGDIQTAVASVAAALGQAEAGRAIVERLQALRRTAPQRTRDTILLGGGGRSVAASGLAAQWLRLAGLRQRPLVGDRVSLEQLLVAPPQVLLRSDYRQGQYSGEQRWLAHPLARRVRARQTLVADGRRWTCMGPSLIREVLRLRQAARS